MDKNKIQCWPNEHPGAKNFKQSVQQDGNQFQIQQKTRNNKCLSTEHNDQAGLYQLMRPVYPKIQKILIVNKNYKKPEHLLAKLPSSILRMRMLSSTDEYGI